MLLQKTFDESGNMKLYFFLKPLNNSTLKPLSISFFLKRVMEKRSVSHFISHILSFQLSCYKSLAFKVMCIPYGQLFTWSILLFNRHYPEILQLKNKLWSISLLESWKVHIQQSVSEPGRVQHSWHQIVGVHIWNQITMTDQLKIHFNESKAKAFAVWIF